jgi:hypothetical protein
MANVIIGIHGLGNKPEKDLLENWWKISMEEGLRTAGYTRKLPDFEMAYWADIVYDKPNNLLEKDENNPCFLDEPYIRGSKDFHERTSDNRKKIVDFLGKQMNRIFLDDDYTLNYSFITDAILNKYFGDLEIYYSKSNSEQAGHGCTLNQLIRERLAALLEKHRDDEIMLIGHSMGSIIAYDVLTFMKPDIRVKTFITIGSPLGLPVVLSKIADERKEAGLESVPVKTPEAISGMWINYSDILDKVAFNYKLSDDYSENSHGIKPVDYLVVNNYEFEGESNAHKAYGYLRTKEFAGILNEFVLSEKLIPEQKKRTGIDRFISNIKERLSLKWKRTKTIKESKDT